MASDLEVRHVCKMVGDSREHGQLTARRAARSRAHRQKVGQRRGQREVAHEIVVLRHYFFVILEYFVLFCCMFSILTVTFSFSFDYSYPLV